MPLFRRGQVRTDLSYVGDVMDALCCTIDQPARVAGKTLNISGGVPLYIKDVVERACAANAIDVRWRSLPVWPCLAAVKLGEAVSAMRSGRPEPKITAYGLGIFAFSQTLDIFCGARSFGMGAKGVF